MAEDIHYEGRLSRNNLWECFKFAFTLGWLLRQFDYNVKVHAWKEENNG